MRQGYTPNRQNPIAKIFIDHPFMTEHHPHQMFKMPIEKFNQRFGVQRAGQCAEINHIGHQQGRLVLLAIQIHIELPGNDHFGHLGGKHLAITITLQRLPRHTLWQSANCA